ncbi:tetratricopeptide repeat protein [Amphritea pacifica]|uniref:surface lipoprotein assembly modifier n=1 Tax=Amphritea pacifica TaxID=2811233 RepID=UPI001E43B101|nr:tetratricopeptide repeat protein [Amphritea pacifica]
MLIKLTGIALLTGLFCTHGYASESGAALIKALLDEGRFNEAYDLSMTYLQGFEGDPEFDFQYGVAAIDSGNVSEGVFALERVAFSDPKNPLVRLELARGYYLLQQFDKAQQLFEQVLLLNPPDNVRIRIAQYLDLIEKKQSFPATRVKSFVEIWRGYDSNINSGPESQTRLVTLTSDALGRGNQFNRLRMGTTIEHQYVADRQLDFTLKGDFTRYDDEMAQDYTTLSVSGGHTWIEHQNRYRLGVDLQHFSRDGQRYRDLLGINGSWTHSPDNQSQLRLYGGINLLEYAEDSWKDATQYYLAGNYLFTGRGNWNPLWFAGGFVGQETPDTAGVLADSQVGRVFWGSNIGVQLEPGNDLTLTPVLTYQSSHYAGDDWIYQVRRQDNFAILNISLEWAVEKNWTVLADLSSYHADSNIELYEYDRHQGMLGLRYSFK